METLQDKENLFKILTSLKKRSLPYTYGILSIYCTRRNFRITYHGNMGASINTVDESLSAFFDNEIVTVSNIKKHTIVESEKGSPDYSYTLIFRLPAA